MSLGPPLNAIRAFEAAARHLSFKRAAEELHVTPGAVSRHIANLEAFLHTKLFVRQHKRIELTVHGATYGDRLRRAFAQIDRATADLVAMRSHGMLNVKVTPTCAFRWFVPRLARFNARFPDLPVHVTTSHKPVDFGQEDIDAAIQYNPLPAPGVAVRKLFSEVLVPVCSPALATRPPDLKRPEDLRNHVLLYSLQRKSDWEQWFAAAGISHVMAGSELAFEDSSLAFESAASGLGVAIARTVFVVDELRSGRLMLPFDPKLRVCSDSGYYLVHPEENGRDPIIKAFSAWLDLEVRQTLDSLPAELS